MLRIVHFLHIIVAYIIELPGLHLLFEGKCIGIYWFTKLFWVFWHPISVVWFTKKWLLTIHCVSQSFYNLYVPSARTNLGKTAFEYLHQPSDWNSLQMKLQLNQLLVSLSKFKTLLRPIENDLMICKCFLMLYFIVVMYCFFVVRVFV